MKRSKGYNDDPSWSRSTAANVAKKKRQQMFSRSSRRLLWNLVRKKRAVDRGKEKIVCCPHSVEIAVQAASPQGDESNKLLFMLALGLLPNTNAPGAKKMPHVKLVRLDPQVEAEAKARTRDVIYQIFQQRKMESMQRRIYEASNPRPSRVEVVDLVSSDEESYSGSDDESDPEPVIVQETLRTSLPPHHRFPIFNNGHASHPHREFPELESSGATQYRVIQCSLPRKPVFKSLGNSPDNGIFRNWKPESMTRLMNKAASNNPDPVQVFNSRSESLLSSLKSLPNSSTLVTLNNFAAKFTQGSKSMSQLQTSMHHPVIQEDTPPSSVGSGSDSEYVLPHDHDAVITID